MGKSQETFGKKEKEKKKAKKREEKMKKREERKANNSKGAAFEDMISYVDENGHLTDTPPDPTKKAEIDAESIEIGIPKKEDMVDVPNQGKVAFFDSSKGYGFINDLNSGDKYFVHVSGLLDEIKENDKVTFDLEKGLKGMNAVRVKKI
ncbi:cold shock domain-containing protein [Flavobacteriales bacterium]|nr:cold shock domain-containing protein [Flavobacteriales bacterium]